VDELQPTVQTAMMNASSFRLGRCIIPPRELKELDKTTLKVIILRHRSMSEDTHSQTTREEAKVLSFIVDDYYGLWEVVDILGSQAGALAVVQSLLSRHWVYLSREETPAVFVPLEGIDADKALWDAAAWGLPPDAVWVATTELGDAAYLKIPLDLLPADCFPVGHNPQSRP
jgi:hypothetical protein